MGDLFALWCGKERMSSWKGARCLVPRCRLKVPWELSEETSVWRLGATFAMEVTPSNLPTRKSLIGLERARAFVSGPLVNKPGFTSNRKFYKFTSMNVKKKNVKKKKKKKKKKKYSA